MVNQEELTYVDSNGVVSIDPNKLDELVSERKRLEAQWLEFEEESKQAILAALAKAGMVSCKTKNYNVSTVCGRDKVEFDEDKFLEENSQEVLAAFVEVEEVKTFDMERLEREYPALVAELTKVDMVTHIDLKKLEKTMPDLFNKYATIVKSDRAPTIKVTGVKR